MRRYADRDTVVAELRLTLASAADSASSSRVDVRQVDVGVDDPKNEAKTSEYQYGDDAAGHPLHHYGRRC